MPNSDGSPSPVEYDSEEVNGPRPKTYRRREGPNASSRPTRRASDAASAANPYHQPVPARTPDVTWRDLPRAVQTPARHVRVIQSSSPYLTSSPLSQATTGRRTTLTPATDYPQLSPAVPLAFNSRRPPKPLAFESKLSGLLENFASIGSGDYEACYAFVKKYPNIWKCDEELLVKDAYDALGASRESHAKRCIQRAVMIQHCSRLPASKINTFIESLVQRKRNVLAEFLADCEDATAKLKAKLPASIAPTSERTVPQDPNPLATIGSTSLQSRHVRDVGEQRSADQFSGLTANTRQDTSYTLPFQSGHPRNSSEWRSIGQLSGPGPSLYQGKYGPVPSPGEYSRNMGEQRPNDLVPVSTSRPHHDAPNQRVTNPTYSRTTTDEIGAGAGAAGAVARPGRQRGPSDVPTVPDTDLRHMRDTLDARYKIRHSSTTFFTVGKVFATPWHTAVGAQQAAALRNNNLSDWVVNDCFGGSILTHIQRMVVVKEGHGFSWCIFINTYHGRGVAKSGFSRTDRLAHAIVYMRGTDAQETAAEKGMMEKNPIGVIAAATDQKLDAMSRINFGKVYTIEHNIKVMDVGRISGDDMDDFRDYWDEYR